MAKTFLRVEIKDIESNYNTTGLVLFKIRLIPDYTLTRDTIISNNRMEQRFWEFGDESLEGARRVCAFIYLLIM